MTQNKSEIEFGELVYIPASVTLFDYNSFFRTTEPIVALYLGYEEINCAKVLYKGKTWKVRKKETYALNKEGKLI